MQAAQGVITTGGGGRVAAEGEVRPGELDFEGEWKVLGQEWWQEGGEEEEDGEQENCEGALTGDIAAGFWSISILNQREMEKGKGGREELIAAAMLV